MAERCHPERPRPRLVGLAVGLTIGGIVAGGLLWSRVKSDDGSDRAPLRAHAAQRTARRVVGHRVWQTRGRRILADLRRDEETALDDALAPVNAYFVRAGRGTKRFSEAVLSSDAQWALVSAKVATLLEGLDRLPSWLRWRWLNHRARILATVLDRRAFHRYVQGQLARHVLTRAGVERVVRRAIDQYQRRLAANDAALADAVGDPSAAPRGATPLSADGPHRFETVYQATARTSLDRSRSGAHTELLNSLIGRLGSKILVALAAYGLKKGAVELGLLSAATASALWSFGVGLAVAALANVALGYLMDRIGRSPGKVIGRRLAAEVASMRRCLVEGCTRQVGADSVTITGLRARLQRYRANQARRRARTLRRALGAEAT